MICLLNYSFLRNCNFLFFGMSQIDSLLNFVAGNTENRKVMSSVDDGGVFGRHFQLDVFSWLLINCDLFTLNNDSAVASSSKNSRAQESAGTAASSMTQQVGCIVWLGICCRRVLRHLMRW